jgi:uncharacterized protein YbjT (DUF2867 family)
MVMKSILITGATGNTGIAIIKALTAKHTRQQVIAGVRNVHIAYPAFEGHSLHLRHFDFESPETFSAAFANIDILFLLRPPHISDVRRYFVPLISTAVTCQVKHIVFLSVQGVENSRLIPHYKIEKLIKESKIPFTFIRPAYFMQNFTTTLNADLVKNKQIFLPAGDAKFTLIDVDDIGKVVAAVLGNAAQHAGQSYELTGDEPLSFEEMAQIISDGTGSKIKYISPNLLSFILEKRKQQIPLAFIMVMIMLHYLPRFQKTPRTTDWVKSLTGDDPKTFQEFVMENKLQLA